MIPDESPEKGGRLAHEVGLLVMRRVLRTGQGRLEQLHTVNVVSDAGERDPRHAPVRV